MNRYKYSLGCMAVALLIVGVGTSLGLALWTALATLAGRFGFSDVFSTFGAALLLIIGVLGFVIGKAQDDRERECLEAESRHTGDHYQ